MKKKFIFISAGILACAITLSSCVKRTDDPIISTSKPDEPTTQAEADIEISVNFNVDGGTNVDPITVKQGSKIQEPVVTKDKTLQYSYKFAGWYLNSDFSTKFDFNNPINENITLYAKWERSINEYQITWLDADDTLLKTEKVKYGLVPSFTPENKSNAEFTYTFVGWDTTPTLVTGDKTYKAVYTTAKNKYDVVWKNGDTVLKSEEVEYGITPSYSGNEPTKDADAEYTYTFAGWTPEVDKVTGDVTYIATFDAVKNKYTITFKNGDTILQSTEVEYGLTPSYLGSEPTKESTNTYNYTFKGWDSDLDAVSGNKEYNAVFEEKFIEYNVKFVDYNNEVIDNKSYHYGDDIIIPADPAREATPEFSYTFNGWDSIPTIVSGNKTFKATYLETKNKYKIIFKKGDDILQSSEVEYDVIPVYTGNEPTKEANAEYTYTFAGWNEEIVAVSGAKTYTATFDAVKNKYTITFKNGDTILQSTEVEYGLTPSYLGSEPTKESTNTYNYTFKGWDSDLDAVSGNKEYNAVFEEKFIEYNVKFVDYNNEVIDNKSYHYGDDIIIPADPAREATPEFSYTFNGWDSIPTIVSGNKTFKATYLEAKNKYSVSFDTQGGSIISNVEVEYGKTVLMPTDPTLSGMNFEGWYLEKECVNAFDFSSVIIDNVTLYAKWTTAPIQKYAVTFVYNNGAENVSFNVNEGNKISKPSDPTKDATVSKIFTFDTWCTDAGLSNPFDFGNAINSDITLYARYNENARKYLITFKNGEDILQSTEVEYDNLPAYNGLTPTKESTAQYNYSFNGWDAEIVKVNGEAIYNATFTETLREYTITWKDYNGNILSTESVKYGLIPSTDNPTRESTAQYDYSFNGWTPNVVTVSGDATYIATYTETFREYTITWLDDDNTVIGTSNVKYGTSPVYPNSNPTKASTAEFDYTFKGWTPTISSVTGEASYKATYIANRRSYNVTFKNGEDILQSGLVEYGETPEYTGVTPTKDSTVEFKYTFKGWNKNILPVNGDVVYEALFDEETQTYEITWLNDDNTIIDKTNVLYGETPTHADASKLDDEQYIYTFAGWTPEIINVSGNMSYKATYSKELKSYQITWLNDDDTIIDTTTVKYGVIPTHNNPTKASTVEWDFTFVGWTPNISSVTGETSYKATYTASRRNYTVTFKNGEDILQSGLVEYGETPEYTGVTPTKESTAQYDYSFVGWNTTLSSVTGDVIYVAQFDSVLRQYTYTFLNEDGTSIYKTITADYGTEIIKPADPTKATDLYKKYTFIGWFTDKTGGSAVTEFNTLNSNVAYYARFNEEDRKYNINWMDGTNVLSSQNNVSYDSTYPNGTPTKADYVFTGWNEVIDGNTITRTAIFEETKSEYTVTWLNDDNQLLRVDTVLKNEKASYGTKPVKSGYKFLYWSKDGIEFDLNTNITSNITLKAVYGEVISIGFGGSYTPWEQLITEAGSNSSTDSKGRYVLNTDVSLNGYTFVNNNKNLVSKDKSQYNNQGSDILITLSKTGSLFVNGSWASTSSSGYITVKNSSNEEVYKSGLISGSGTNCSFEVEDLPAGTYTIHSDYSVNFNNIHYEIAKEYKTVSFVSNILNVNIDPVLVVAGMNLDNLPDIQRDNYKLAGWYTDPSFDTQFNISNAINDNITLYAKWVELTNDEKATVSFASNVSGISFDSITIQKGNTIVLPTQNVAGYRFDNWYTNSSHTNIFNPQTIINEDITIYANYIKQWTITYKDMNMNVIGKITVDNDTVFGEVASVTAPYVEGYLFEYWEKNGIEFTSTDDILSDITLVAHYKQDDGSAEKLSITRTEGLQESAYILFDEYNDATDYAIYEVDNSNNTKRLSTNDYYITKTNTGLRADLFGLKAGSHKIIVAPEIAGSEVLSLGAEATFNVEAYDRSGFAHFNNTEGVGAYNDDGTMKANAIVLYVTDKNKNTIELTYKGTTVKGIGNILNSVGQDNGSGKTSNGGITNTNQGILKKLANDNIPLIIRFVGCVSETGLNKKGTYDASSAGLIDGLTEYDSVDYGGSVGDNGHMARMKSGKNITLEGVGSGATIDGWGFHFMCESSSPNLGKNFEVRNLTFINTPEDAIGMEGVQDGSTITASVERCWIHNNEFYSPTISNPAESDKSEGDGSCDFKRGMYFTCSYNYFEGCHKTNLVGSSDSSLQYNLTYHHNYWYICKARGPLARQANIHMYNNIFYGQTDFCMNTRANAYIFSESNLFYACKNPFRVDSGAIKSYNDSVSSAVNYSSPSIVTDKNQAVSSNCGYNGVSYSSFELSDSLFYKNDYYLQADPTDAKKVIYARCGTAKASLPVIENVTISDVSYVNAVKETTVNNLAVNGNTTTIAKLSKEIYAFKITESATATVGYSSDALTSTGVLCNEAGVALLTASGTIKLTPGIYFIQAFTIGAGDAKTLKQPEFKELTNVTIKLDAYDDTDYQNQLISEFNSLINSLGTIEYNDISYAKINDAYQKYNQLNSASKASVSANYNKLVEANNTYKSKGISYVEGVINQIITPVTESNANKVYAARSAYNELLTKIPSASVSNYQNLVDAEKQLESIAVNLFLQKVSELPTTIVYSDECLQKIISAENAYDALTEDQKKLEEDGANVVSAHQTLVNARNQYNNLAEEANKVDVIFMVDGVEYASSRITKNTTISLPTNPTKAGYRFDNWYLDQVYSNKFNSSSKINENTVLYARFVEQITVTFMNMDGNTVLTTKLVDKNGAMNLSDVPNAKYETGYKFKYWSLSKNGEAFDFLNDFANNTTLYAVYEESSVNTIDVKLYGGDLESLYVEFNKLDSFTDYNAYIKRDGDASYKLLDKQLIRQYSNYYRVDAVGLKAGTYSIKLVPFANTSEVSEAATTLTNIVVKEHIRTGFAFVNGSASGAYNNDGTLKSNAQVVYVTETNKDTVTLKSVDKKGASVTLTGIQNIITNLKSNTKAQPLCIRLLGNITDPATLIKGDLYIDTATAGLTIEGIGSDATINGFGIVMKNSTNVEIRNLGFMNCNSSEGDSCGLQQGNDHCWVHNCDFFYGDAGSDADQVKGDGALDTKTSTYITHSFNHFFDTGKSNLQGMKSESESNYITYHHNWYDHSDSRHPRIRTCTVHIYNNYFDGNAKYGVGVTMGASAFVENNYFRSTATMKPMLISMQGTDAKGAGTFSGEDGGVIKAYGNTFDGNVSFISHTESSTSFDAYLATSRDEKVPASYVALQGGTKYNNFDTDSSLMYSYDVETPEEAKNTVTAYAGRVQGGDFKWTFSDSEDSQYNVNNSLKSALVNYSGKLISVLGIEGTQESGETPIVDTSYQDVIDLIDALPNPQSVTLADTDKIYAARSSFQKLSSENQALVTNYSKLQQCIAKLNELGNDDEDETTGLMIDFSDNKVNATGTIPYSATSGYKTGAGSVEYNGKTYTTAAKIDSNATITITPTSSCTLKIWAQGKSSGNSIAVGDTKLTLTASPAMYEVNLSANQSYEIKKSSGESYIYLIVIE